ncbi:MAG: hypothetical protein L0Y80_07395 [Ignavibacteriae bacterium]|nr:hypothetical protein [Ignavibacteriota bacterium]
MNEHAGRITLYVLVLVHVFLGVWAIAGWIEWFSPTVPWNRLSNPAFDQPMLFVHWSAILAASVAFLWGFSTRSRRLPLAMTVIYIAMAAICAVQTFWYMETDTKYSAMALEYAEYSIILLLLWRVKFFREYFSK